MSAQLSMNQFIKRPRLEPENEPGDVESGPTLAPVSVDADVDLTEQSASSSSSKVYKFQSNWSRMFPWLKIISIQEKKVYCSICKSEKAKTQWATEKILPEWRKFQLSYHDKQDKDHKKAVEAQSNRPKQQIEKSASISESKVCEGTVRLMTNVMFIVQKNLPLNIAEDLHNLIIKHGQSVDKPLILPSAHKSSFSTYQFLDALNLASWKSDAKKIQDALCFNLHIDESTDITEEKQLMMYVTYWDGQKPKPNFLALKLLGSANAEAISSEIVQFFNENKIALKKMVLFTSDGAAVMLDKKSGVAKRLMSDYGIEHLIQAHCVAHREALAVKDVLNEKSAKHFWRVEQITKELISFLTLHSSKVELQELCTMLENIYLVPKRIFEIRWLSRFNVVNTLLKMIHPICALVESKDHNVLPLIKGLKKRMFDYSYLLSLFILRDILEPLNSLMIHFQKDVIHPFEIPDLVNNAVSELEELYLGETFYFGQQANIFDTAVKDNTSVLLEFIKPNTISDVSRQHVIQETIQFVSKIKQAIGKRLINEHEILSDFAIFMPKPEIIESLSPQEKGLYGTKEIEKLAEFYKFFDIDDNVVTEWNDFKRYSVFSQLSPADCKYNWYQATTMCAQRQDLYPNLSKLCIILLTFNMQNAVVERGFSIAHAIKTKARSSLSVEILESLIRLRLNVPNLEEFDYEKAYKIWIKKSKKGRYNIGSYGKINFELV